MKKTGEHKTFGILIKKTLLVNDDGILEFFTSDFGRITVFVKKLAQSKKKAQEIDFFRLLEIILFEGRNSKSLRSINTISLFHAFERNYTLNEMGFEWLERLHHTIPEEKKCSLFFTGVMKLLSSVEEKNAEFWDIFFRTKCLTFSGLFPHFNEMDSFYSLSKRISPSVKKTLELLRTSTLEEYKKIYTNLPEQNIESIKKVLGEIEGINV